jgi:serine peptidase DegS
VSDALKIAGFVGRSIAAGLAAAFVVVLLRPDLIRTTRPAATAPTSSYADAVLASSPAVANVYTERTLNGIGGRSDLALRGRALGSAVVISRDGYLVTNWHVIRDADEIRVQLADGRVATPELVGADPETELALLRVDLPNLPAIELGRSDSLRVGEVVLAIGNSLGLSQTVTMGIVSATGRGPLGVTTFADFIQTDAAINIGNSGGALVNTAGELVGINTAVISSPVGDQAPPEGIGFAIPVNLVRGVMAQLIEHGRVIRGYLDVETTNLPARDARSFGIEDGPAVLLRVVNGPAAAAGLLPGDALTHINDTRILSQEQAMTMVASLQPGERVRIRAARPGGERIVTEAVLEERPLREGS